MTPDQIRRIRSSFALLLPIADEAAQRFYANLFEADPSLKPMFRGDMRAQGVKLMQMIGGAVGLLDKPHALMPVLRNLGQRHVGYGVRDAHYETVGAALIKTLEQGLGDAFGPATKEAWVTMYEFVAGAMQQAAKQPPHAEALAA